MRWFLLFLAALLGALVVAAFLLGPNVLGFVFHDERRTTPFVMVNLLEFRDDAAAERYLNEASNEVLGLLEGFGGKRVWAARVEGAVEGKARDRWQEMALVEYPSRAAYVEMVTSSAFRKAGTVRDALLSRSALLVGTPRVSLAVRSEPLFAVRLIQFMAPADADIYLAEWLPKERQLLHDHEAEIVWDARLDALVGDRDDWFEHVILAAFANDTARNTWVTSQRTADADKPRTAAHPPRRRHAAQPDAPTLLGQRLAQIRTLENSSNSPRFGSVACVDARRGAGNAWMASVERASRPPAPSQRGSQACRAVRRWSPS